MKRTTKHKLLQRFIRLMWRRFNPPPVPLNQKQHIVKLPQNYIEAAKSLEDKAAMQTPEYRDKQVISYEGMHPELMAFYRAFQKELQRRNIPMFPFTFMRSAAEQNRVHRLGNSNAIAGQSAHQYGCAFDLISATKYWNLTEKQWVVIYQIGKEIARKRNLKVVWGGDWDGDGDIYDNKLFDAAHWELKDWREYKEIMDDAAISDKQEAMNYAYGQIQARRRPKKRLSTISA